jgi:iron complex outermembrane receptor protein
VNVTSKQRRSSLLGSAAGLALFLGFAGAAYAQAPAAPAAPAAEEEGTLDEIVVTGVRASINNAVKLKEASDNIVEVVSAEDIGKLPDVSIAESLARLPGLAIQRLDGRGQQLSVRGLGPDYTTALLNGREQVTVGDNRGVEFDQFPSDLLSGVVVYKTPDGALVGQGLMGTVDMRTLRPLSLNKRILAGSARYEWNEKGALNPDSDDNGYRLNFTYADKFMDGKLGVALGLSSISTPTQSERFNAWGYPNAGPGGALVIGGSKSYVQSNDLDRTGAIGIIEYAPTDNFKTSVDMYYSNFEETQNLRGIELPLAWSSATLAPGATVSNGFVTAGTFNGVKGVIRNDLNLRQADLYAVGWNAQWNLDNGWDFEVDLSTSNAKRDDRYLETYSGTGPAGVGATDALGFRTIPGQGTRFSPTLNYGDFNTIFLTSPQGWGTDAGAGRPFGQSGFDNNPSTDDTLSSLRLSAGKEIDLGIFTKLEAGVNISQREKEKTVNEFFLAVAGGAPQVAIPTSARLGTTNLGFLGLGNMVSYNPLAVISSGAMVRSRNSNADVITKAWSVTEDIQTFFMKADFETELGTSPVRGNVGLQVVQTDQESSGAAGNNGAFGRLTVGDSYTEYLPSLNVIANITDETVLRFSAARTLARARMDQLSASQTVSINASRLCPIGPPPVTGAACQALADPSNPVITSSGGNPTLRPFLANGLDVSLERYFGEGGYVALAGYYKQLDNWVFGSFPQPTNFSSIAPIVLTPAELARLPSANGISFSPRNLEGGYIRGLEFSFSVPMELVAEQLDGFGILFSASTTDSEIEPISGVTIPVPGLSENVINSTIYYEKAGFQARVSNRFRSEFLGEVNGFGGGRDLRRVAEESVLDAQIGYTFQSGPLEGLNITFQGLNLTDEPFTTYAGLTDDLQTIDYQKYGSTFLIGASWKLN